MDSRLFSKKESKQGIQEPFPSLPCVVHELKESEIVGQRFLRLAAAGAAKKATEKAYKVCKNIRCEIKIHGPHHRFGWPFNKRMCHVQLTCWVKGRKGSTFIRRFPYPCDGPGAPGTPSNPNAPRGSNNPSGPSPNDLNTRFSSDIPGVPSWGMPR
jgi:hypothetical protein